MATASEALRAAAGPMAAGAAAHSRCSPRQRRAQARRTCAARGSPRRIREPAAWPAVGHDYGDTRYSPLRLIDDHNVGRLSLAWYYDLDTHRGQEATPLVVDGVMYITSAWSMV